MRFIGLILFPYAVNIRSACLARLLLAGPF